MASIVQLKRSAVSGKVPDTGSLNLGELAVNTYDGKIYFKKSGSLESIESILTTNSTTSGSIRLEGTASFGSLKVNDTLTVNHGVSVISGSLGVTSDLTVLGAINARQFNISVISSSILFESGSSKFGDTLDDIHNFTGSVNITGSLLLNGQEVGGGTTSGSFTGSFTGDGSGLRGVVSDDLPIDGWDYNSNSSASISEFNNESRKYLIDFQWDSEVGTPIGFKTFISNVTGSSQIVPTEAGIKFIVGNQQVALVGPNGIESVTPAGTVSGSSQLTSSYDNRYVLSGSITQTTWDNIASKPSGIVSGSSQVIDILSSLNTFTASISTASLVTSINNLNTFTASQSTASLVNSIDNLNSTTASLNTSISNLNQFTTSISTASLVASINNLNLFSSSQFTQNSSLATISGSLILTASNLTQRVSSIELVSGTFATTGSNTFFGTQTFSGSLYVANDLIVQGSSSIQYISASSVSIGTNIIQLNTANPSVRYAGLSIIDSGSIGGSGSFLYDSVQDEFIFVHRGDGTNITSSHFVLGPETYNNLGNESYLTNNRLPKGTGKEHLNDSQIIDDGTTVSIPGNLDLTGSIKSLQLNAIATITGSLILTASANVVSISNLNSFSSSQLTQNTNLATITGSLILSASANTISVANLNAASSSYETKGRGIFSGSSQVDVMSTTNIARLATTGSNIFIGNQTITGSLYLSGSNNGSTPLVAFRASGTGTFQRGVQLLNPGMGTGDSIMYSVGKSDNSKNMGQFYFHHAGDSSNNNRISVGLHSVDDVFNVMGSNEVLIGTTTTNSAGKLQVAGNIVPEANGTRDLGSASYRWSTVYTSDLSLNNGIGDWTIVEGEDDLFLYNNKKGKVYKFALTEVDPSVATPKKS